MQIDDCSSRNEFIRFEAIKEFSADMKAAVARFFRHIGAPHVFREIIEPLTYSSKTLFVAAISDRPWPPRGVGAQVIEGLAIAVIGEGNRAFLTPVLASPQNVTNVGLMSALTKKLFEELNKEYVQSMIYLARTDSALLAQILVEAGFELSGERVITETSNFVHFAAHPEKGLKWLGLAERRVGDLLSLSIESSQVSKLALYHLGLSAAAQNFWSDRIDLAVLLPGLIDWIATSPPGGIGGTPGPKIPGVDSVSGLE
jgi:hypothetical protein